MLAFVILVIVIVALWFWRPDWFSEASRKNALQQMSQATSKVTETTKGAVVRAEELAKTRLPFRGHQDLDIQVKNWMIQVNQAKGPAVFKALLAESDEFTEWLQKLSDERLGEFMDGLSAFCKGSGFDMTWLVDPKVEGEMRQALEEAVILYYVAAWKGSQVKPFAVYRTWQSAPAKPDNQAFAQRLFSKLAAAGLVTSTPDLLLAPEKKRLAYVQNAIESVAAQNPKAFADLLREVTNELAAPEPAPTAAVASA